MSYLDSLALIWNFLLFVIRALWGVYAAQPVLMSVLTLWVLDRLFGIFDLIKG